MAIAQADLGGDVKTLQKKLYDFGLYNGKIDGVFGPLTQNAMTNYQLGLTPSGNSGLPFTNNMTIPSVVQNPTIAPTVAPVNPITATATQPVVPIVGATMPAQNPVPDAKIVAPTTTPTTPPTGGTTSTTPTTGLPVTTPTTPDFAYDPTKDAAYQAAIAETNRSIQNAMNRRGIYGSTIMQEGLRSADVKLMDTYTNLAKDKYDKELSDRQDAMDRAYANAKKRGYYNNEEAAMWGVKPGTRISSGSSSSSSSSSSSTAYKDSDGTAYDKDGTVVLNAQKKAIMANFKSSYNKTSEDPLTVINWLMNRKDLTDGEKAYIISSMGLRDGKSAEDWLQEWYDGTVAQNTQDFVTNNTDPRIQQIINQENRWGY
jgi:hypothetical protein